MTPTNASEFLQLQFLSSYLEERNGAFWRVEFRKDPVSGLKWKWSFPIQAKVFA